MTAAADLLATIAAVLVAAGALARLSTRRRAHVTGVPLLLLGWTGLVLAIAPSSIRDQPVVAVAALLVAAVAGWFLAGRLVGRESWLLAAGAVALTLRVPVPTGDGNAMLLGPLYVVIALGALTVVRREVRPDSIEAGPRPPDRVGATRMLDAGLVAVPVVAALTSPWSFDRIDSTQALAFFLVPFPLAAIVVRAWLAVGVRIRPAAIALVATGVACALVGLLQAATRHVWWNPKVIESNRFRPDFRTNSLFWDPNIYGRALVVALLAIVAWALLARASRARLAAAAAVAGLLVVALWNTYSQSSWFALAAALVLVAVLTLPPRPRRWVAAALALVMVAGLPIAADGLSGSDSAGREDVVRTGLALGGEQPVLGWGIGTFEGAALARAQGRGEDDPGLVASHTTPITVLAELGVVGLAAYVALLASVAVTILARWRRTSTPAAAVRAVDPTVVDPGWPQAPVVWASATIAALLAHSLLYAGFFEDATLWVALALLGGLPARASGPGYDLGDAVHTERAVRTTSPR